MKKNDNNLKIYNSPSLMSEAKLEHGFVTRNSGYSQGNFSSLNFSYSCGDAKDAVDKNWHKLITNHKVPRENFITVKQIHSNRAVLITQDNYQETHTADAMVTQEPSLYLCILTADCCPILIYEKKHKIIAAIHAGWRSAKGGIIQNTIKTMRNLGGEPKNMFAVIGPTISQKKYEVGQEFRQSFIDDNLKNNLFFTKAETPNKFKFDLVKFNLYQLQEYQIKCANLNLCTYDLSADFFSYRRNRQLKLGDCGRQLSYIALIK